MAADEAKLIAAKKSYRNAKASGTRQEEARWANVVGNMLKNRGECVEALHWFRIDYDISVKYLPPSQCLATCQSLGEVYLHLEHFDDALLYQKKHLELAENTNDLVEQQRANTQLGRTYHEMFLKSENDHYSVRSAKKHFKAAMELAQAIKENPPTNSCSFLKEYIDVHNNMGLLEFDLDNLDQARKFLAKGLEICDEEEVKEDDDARSRLHHNLGNVYMELRIWDNAREHIEKDIMICNRIGHCQGEAKGYMSLGGLHYRIQKYGESLVCYQKAHNLAKSMEDEDALLNQIYQNIGTVKEAIKVMYELKKEEQNLKKLTRDIDAARGKPHERKCMLKKSASLDYLIEKSRTILAWLKLCEFAKMKKIIATELCEKEQLSDSFLVIGESYQNLREFKKAFKWYMKSWETYKSIGQLEGQALTKTNVGNVLDSHNDWQGALEAFEESYRIALEANLPSVQITALENMHYSYMIRFDNVEEARRMQILIDKVKQPKRKQLQTEEVAEDRCSESDTEGSGHLSDGLSNSRCSLEIRTNSSRSESLAGVEELKDDVPLISYIHSMIKMKSAGKKKVSKSTVSPKKLSNLNPNVQTVVCCKRVRAVLSDDEDEMRNEVECSKSRPNNLSVEDFAASREFKSRRNIASPIPACKFQDDSALKHTTKFCDPVNKEESSSSCKSRTPDVVTQKGKDFRCSSSNEGPIAASGSKCGIVVSENLADRNSAAHPILHTSDDKHNQCIAVKIDKDLIHCSFVASDKLSIESLKFELACLYYLQLPMERRSQGLLPIIQNIKYGERIIESVETIVPLQEQMGKVLGEACIAGWVQKLLIKLYADCCDKLSETPNRKLLEKLYDLELTDDDVTVSECELQDLSITPLLNALEAHKTFAMLDLSHNLLGNGTMERLQKVITSSAHKCIGLTLDLHNNMFGPSALFQICECPLLFARLEVLNMSGNRLTDVCASYLSTILENCKALSSLSIERCYITDRTIQKVADALNAGSVLEQLCIGYNPISGSVITRLLVKLGLLKRFSNLSLSGLKLRKPVFDTLCHFAKTTSLSVLMLRDTGIGTDGALVLTESLFSGTKELVKLDLSYCGVTSNYVLKLSTGSSMISGILELNLSGNLLMQEGSNALSSILLNSQCRLKVLVLEKCELGVAGVLQIIQALSGYAYLEELNVAGNANLDEHNSAQFDMTAKGSLERVQPNLDIPKEVNPAQHLRVIDDENDQLGAEDAEPGHDYSCTSICARESLSSEFQFIQKLSTSIDMATNLRFLDLSSNGFSKQSAELLYTAWSRSRCGLARKHIKDQTVHLFLQGIKCCVKPCCRKD